MTVYNLSILNYSVKPDNSGNAFIEPYSVKATNDLFDDNVLIFNDSGTRIGFKGKFQVPLNYVGTALIKPIWSSTAVTGNLVWDFDYRAIGGDDTESMDQATAQESVTVTDASPTAIHRRLTPSLTLTSGNLVAGDTVEYFFVRDGTDAADTMAAAGILFDLLFSYSDV